MTREIDRFFFAVGISPNQQSFAHENGAGGMQPMALPKAFWLLWCGQTFSRIGILAPAFLVPYLEQVN
jgi:hypothetical protein